MSFRERRSLQSSSSSITLGGGGSSTNMTGDTSATANPPASSTPQPPTPPAADAGDHGKDNQDSAHAQAAPAVSAIRAAVATDAPVKPAASTAAGATAADLDSDISPASDARKPGEATSRTQEPSGSTAKAVVPAAVGVDHARTQAVGATALSARRHEPPVTAKGILAMRIILSLLVLLAAFGVARLLPHRQLTSLKAERANLTKGMEQMQGVQVQLHERLMSTQEAHKQLQAKHLDVQQLLQLKDREIAKLQMQLNEAQQALADYSTRGADASTKVPQQPLGVVHVAYL